MYNGTAYPIGASIANLNSAVAAYVNSHSDDGDEPDPDPNNPPPDPDEGELKDGLIKDDVNTPS
jgi:hypothetical protein